MSKKIERLQNKAVACANHIFDIQRVNFPTSSFDGDAFHALMKSYACAVALHMVRTFKKEGDAELIKLFSETLEERLKQLREDQDA